MADVGPAPPAATDGPVGAAAAVPVRYTDEMTAFVKGLQPSVQDGELRALFEPCGGLKDVRPVRNPEGMCRGFAYVDFETEVRRAWGRAHEQGPKADDTHSHTESEPDFSCQDTPTSLAGNVHAGQVERRQADPALCVPLVL